MIVAPKCHRCINCGILAINQTANVAQYMVYSCCETKNKFKKNQRRWQGIRCFDVNVRYSQEDSLITEFNSSPPRASYMRQWIGSTLVQLMACRLFGAKAPSHYLNQSWNIVIWTLMSRFQWNPNRNSYTFIQENASENIFCLMTVVLFQGEKS